LCNALNSCSHVLHPRLRSLPDRLRQIALFEVGGLLLITRPSCG
jgi:hypothetical protein